MNKSIHSQGLCQHNLLINTIEATISMNMNVTKFMYIVIQPNSLSLKQPNIWKQPVTYQLTSIFWTTLLSIESLKSTFLT